MKYSGEMDVLNKTSCLHLTCERIVSESFSSFIHPIYSHNTILLVTFLFRTSNTEDNWLRRKLPWTSMHNITLCTLSKQCNLLVMLWLMFNFTHFHAQTKINTGCILLFLRIHISFFYSVDSSQAFSNNTTGACRTHLWSVL